MNMAQLLTNIYNYRSGKLGKVFVKYAEPINLNQYVEQNQGENLALKLTRDLYQAQQKEQPITMNCLITSALHFYPKKEVPFKTIRTITKNLYDYILYKRYKTYVATSPQNFDINVAVLNLGFDVIGKPLDKKQGANARVNMEFDGDQMLKALSMSYYGN